MAIIPVSNLGAVGLVAEVMGQELPLNAWTNASNIRFKDGSAQKFKGEQRVYGDLAIAPMWLLPVPVDLVYWWLYAGVAKVYATDQTSHYNITRQTSGNDVDYSASGDNKWTGCVLGGVPVINNGADDPQMWLPVSSSQRLVALTNWPANTKCASIRSYKQFLVALDILKGATRYSQMVKWSHQALPGAVPTTWNEADATKDAGEYSITDTAGAVVDCVTLRDANVIYKEDSVWLQQYIGGTLIFKFTSIFKTFGILSRNCAVEFADGKHAVFATDDLIVHNGQQADGILSRRYKRALFSSINTTFYKKAFVVHNRPFTEIWFCYPETNIEFCNKALVWNYEENTTTFRDLPGVSFIHPGVVNAT